MSDHPSHPDSVTDLDANVDALVDQLGVQTDAARDAAHASVATLDAPPLPSPPAACAHADEPSSPDALLSEISEEIERTAPGELPTPPEPPPSNYATPAPLPTDADIAAAAAEVDADLGAFEAPTASEVAHAPDSHPAPVAPASAAHPVSSAPTTERPGPEIKKLDAALAAGAERALASARSDEPQPAFAPAPIEAEPEFEPELPSEPLEPIIVAPPAPVKHEPKPVAVPALTDPALITPTAGPSPSRVRLMLVSAVTLPLRPIAALHERLAEPTRQTIAYCAIITLFFAACVWGRVVFFPAKANLEPHGEAAEFYDDTKPARGITAPSRHAPEGAPGHGDSGHGESGGHGEAKKPDAHAKTEKKSNAHGEEAQAKPEKKSSRAKKTASASGHGGH